MVFRPLCHFVILLILAQANPANAESWGAGQPSQPAVAANRSSAKAPAFPYEGKWKLKEIRCVTVKKQNLWVHQAGECGHFFTCIENLTMQLEGGFFRRQQSVKECELSSEGTYQVLEGNRISLTKVKGTNCPTVGDAYGTDEFRDFKYWIDENDCLNMTNGLNCEGEGIVTPVYCPDLVS